MRIRRSQFGQLALLTSLEAQGLRGRVDESTGDVLATDDRRSAIRLALDQDGLVGEETTPSGRRFRYAYDPGARLEFLERPEGGHLRFRYDAAGRLARLTSGSRVWGLEWDAFGNLARATYPDGTELSAMYSAPQLANRIVSRGNRAIEIARDELGRVTSITDPRGFATKYEYSGSMLADRIVYPDGSAESFSRDTSGRLARAQIGKRTTASLVFDSQKNLQRVDVNGDIETYEYDASGRVTAAVNETIRVSRKYDEKGRLVEDNQGGLAVKFTYEAAGLVESITTDAGDIVRFEYDPDSRLQRVLDWDGGHHEFTYHDAGTAVRQTHPNGTVTDTRLSPDRQPLEIQVSTPGKGRPLFRRYKYDVNDRIERLDDSEHGQRRIAYSRDGELAAVTEASGAIRERYEYDGGGNPVRQNGVRAEFGAFNELRSRGNHEFAYDERGNAIVIWAGGVRLNCRFDGRNRLVLVQGPDGIATHFAYDAFGRRIQKTTGAVTTRYVWAGDVLLSEVTETTKGRERRDYLFAPYSYCPLSMRANGTVYQYHTDHQGTPRWLTDSNGAVVWSGDSAGFGATNESIRAIRQPLRFPGHYFDEETGLHYNRARYYSPDLGRYLSRDPLGILGGINPYTYAQNDPINDCDPLGLLSWKSVAAAAAITAGVGLMIVAAPVILAGAVAVATGAAVAAGTAGMIGAFVGGAALVGVGVGLATTREDQSAGSQTLHVLKYGLFGAAGGASAVMTVFGAAGMAAMGLGGGGGMVLCGAGGGSSVASSAPILAVAGPLGIAATTQMAMSQASNGGGSDSGGGGEGDDGSDQPSDAGKPFTPEEPVHVSDAHSANTIGPNTRFGAGNRNTPKTVVRGDADIAADVADINAGKGTQLPNGDILAPSGRIYGTHPDSSAVFPKSGPGTTQLTQAEFNVYRQMTKSGGLSGDARTMIDGMTKSGNKGLTPDSESKLLDLFNSRQVGK